MIDRDTRDTVLGGAVALVLVAGAALSYSHDRVSQECRQPRRTVERIFDQWDAVKDSDPLTAALLARMAASQVQVKPKCFSRSDRADAADILRILDEAGIDTPMTGDVR